jgi:uncharacterized protein (DUF169 family)
VYNQEIITVIKTVLHIKKELVALKVWKEVPRGLRKYPDNAFPGMCAQIGEALAGAAPFYTDEHQCFCTGGTVATGLAAPPREEERAEIIETHFAISKGHKDMPTALRYEHEIDKIRPPVQERNAAVQIGLLKDVSDPDLVLIFCTPGAADILNRAYSYAAGDLIMGFGGNGGCPFLIQYPYTTKKPSFSYSDVAWRKYVGLADEELTVSFPYQSLADCLPYVPEVAEAYRRYGEPVEA